MRSRRWHRIAPMALALALVAGCAKDDPKIVDPGPTGTVADSPENALRVMAAAFVERDTATYRGLFTSDYRYRVHPDSILVAAVTTDLDWSDEMRWARNCLRLGTSQLAPARTVVCSLSALSALPDDRPGRNPTWHQLVACSLHLTVDALDTVFEVNEVLFFYVVRGDSASTTAEIRGSGGPPENQRWYVERVEPAGTRVPEQQFSHLKQAYLSP